MYKQVPKEEVLLILLEMMLLSNPGKKYCPLLNLLPANSLNLLQIYINRFYYWGHGRKRTLINKLFSNIILETGQFYHIVSIIHLVLLILV